MPTPTSVPRQSENERSWEFTRENLFQRLVPMAVQVVGGRVGLLYWRDGEGLTCRVGAGSDWDDAFLGAKTALPLDDPLVRHVHRTEAPVVIANAAATAEIRASEVVTGPLQARFVAAVPLHVQGAMRGLLCVADQSPRALGTVAHDGLVRTLGDWASVASALIEQHRALQAAERTEWEYHRYKTRHETHIQNTPVAFVQWNTDFEVTGWNPAAASVFGHAEDEALGRDIIELVVPPDIRPEVRDALSRLMVEDGGRYHINENRTKDGRTILCEWYNTSLVDATGTVYGGISLALDITDRVEAQEILEERERDLAVTLNSIGDAVIATDAEGRITRMNPVAEELTGWAINEARGRALGDVFRVVDSSTDEPSRASFTEVLQTGHIHNGQRPVTLIRRDDSECPINDSIAPIRTADGEVRGAVLVFSDATEQHQRERELREAREIAEEMNQLKSSFLANMSHEIRTPLTTIIGFAEIVEEETRTIDELEEAGEFAELIRRSGQRLLETINSVLDLSRLEAGTVHLYPRETEVVSEVRDTADLFRRRTRDAEISLRVEVPDAPVYAHIDPAGLHRVLVNLIGNAIKFTEPGGDITVRVSATERDLAVDVQDTGIGIDAAFVPDLFDAFQQESTGQARLHEGSGLGLTITKQLVELMGGSIEVESEKGVGTVFSVRLPRSASA